MTGTPPLDHASDAGRSRRREVTGTPPLDRASDAGCSRRREVTGTPSLRRFVFWRGGLEARKAPCVAIATFDENSLCIRFVKWVAARRDNLREKTKNSENMLKATKSC